MAYICNRNDIINKETRKIHSRNYFSECFDHYKKSHQLSRNLVNIKKMAIGVKIRTGIMVLRKCNSGET